MPLKVIVKDDNYERALRKFKKKVNELGVLQTIRDREFYEKPTTRRKKDRAAAANRWRKKIDAQALPKKLF